MEQFMQGGKALSPSLRGRGLKSEYELTQKMIEKKSPSLRGRGLKYPGDKVGGLNSLVALFTRAWIEIDGSTPFDYVYTSRPLYEGVD